MTDVSFFATHSTFNSNNTFEGSHVPELSDGDHVNAEIQRFKTKHGFSALILKGVDFMTSLRSCSLASQYLNVYSTFGLSPLHLDECRNNRNNFMLNNMCIMMKEIIRNNSEKIVAIGECGLDFSCTRFSRELQIEILRMQILIAMELQKPIYLFENYAFDEMMTILNELDPKGFWKLEKVIYCPKASFAQIKKYLDLGFYIQVTTMICNEKNFESSNIVKQIPLNKIVTGTNSPFDSPNPQYNRNIPGNLSFVINKLASIFKKPYDVILKGTKDNADRLFNITPVYENKHEIKKSFDKYLLNVTHSRQNSPVNQNKHAIETMNPPPGFVPVLITPREPSPVVSAALIQIQTSMSSPESKYAPTYSPGSTYSSGSCSPIKHYSGNKVISPMNKNKKKNYKQRTYSNISNTSNTSNTSNISNTTKENGRWKDGFK